MWRSKQLWFTRLDCLPENVSQPICFWLSQEIPGGFPDSSIIWILLALRQSRASIHDAKFLFLELFQYQEHNFPSKCRIANEMSWRGQILHNQIHLKEADSSRRFSWGLSWVRSCENEQNNVGVQLANRKAHFSAQLARYLLSSSTESNVSGRVLEISPAEINWKREILRTQFYVFLFLSSSYPSSSQVWLRKKKNSSCTDGGSSLTTNTSAKTSLAAWVFTFHGENSRKFLTVSR